MIRSPLHTCEMCKGYSNILIMKVRHVVLVIIVVQYSYVTDMHPSTMKCLPKPNQLKIVARNQHSKGTVCVEVRV